MPPIARQRLRSQLLSHHSRESAYAVVSHFGAMQAQDYLAALWAVGSRMRTALERDVEDALARREIVRCWPMRGTLHFVAAEDARWMLELLAPRMLSRHRTRLERDFSLDARTLRRARTIAERALAGGKALTRAELYAAFEKAGIASGDGRGMHIVFALAHQLVLCFGARRGKQPTFVLLDEWLPQAPSKPREDALAELARRYFGSHAPAVVEDFMWWSGLAKREAGEAIALAALDVDRAIPAARKATVHLLPPFDEYTVGYKNRSAVIDPSFAKKVNAGGGIINAIVVIDGIVAGSWKRTLRGRSVELRVTPFRALRDSERRGVEQEAARYARFLRTDFSVTISRDLP